ncbi:MAG: cyclic pyranopterin monophosphate synthase MoaC [Clostridia bacterium]
MELTHIGEDGYAKMVAVDAKEITVRTATASGKITMKPETLQVVKSGGIKKGDVLTVAKIAGIMACKKTSELIPMCHNIFIEGCDLSFKYLNDTQIEATATTTATAKTGVEMEALIAVEVALATIYDMAKAIDRGMVISDVCVTEKLGGKSGHYVRKDEI